MKKQWRCFHCDEVFTNVNCAAVHFGLGTGLPACKIAAHEGHLVKYIRNLESQLARYRAEDSDVMRSIMTLEADYRRAAHKRAWKFLAEQVEDGESAGSQPKSE